jgi:hypothetical protein
MNALQSSSALVVNVFDYWRRQNRIQDIAKCCGAEGIINSMEFEKTHPIKGVNRTPPHLDVEFAGPVPLAIESKFTETYQGKTRRDSLREYLKHPDIWNGISEVRALACDIVEQSGARTDFKYLDASQLIKHILGLKSDYSGPFCLLYLWYKVDSDEAEQHQEELDRFSRSIKDEISFRTMTYQYLFNGIRELSGVDSAYIEYLEQRYFPGSQ